MSEFCLWNKGMGLLKNTSTQEQWCVEGVTGLAQMLLHWNCREMVPIGKSILF